MKILEDTAKNQIKRVEITSDKITGRGGLAFILRYFTKVGLLKLLSNHIGHLRFSGKSKCIALIVRQILAMFIDGTDTTLSAFDKRRSSPEYAALIECEPDDIVGTDIVKRFFRKFLGYRYRLFRTILHTLFIWRLQIEQPEVIVLYIDTMVLDNDNALSREGCKPTYKKKKGYQPLHVHWGPYIVDMEFRSGEKHSNYGKGVSRSITTLIKLIRKKYRANVPVIIKCDSGFLSEETFNCFEDLGTHYIGMGKLYDYLYKPFEHIDLNTLPTVSGPNASWAYYEFGSRFKTGKYKKFRRTIFTTITREGEQCVLRGIRPDSFIHTNIGCNPALDEKLKNADLSHYLNAEEIIRLAHTNGADELNHRSIKEFMGTEHLPFKRFGMNGAYYSLMVIAHFIMESFRKDIGVEVQPIRCYPTTFRRRFIDFAVKIVKTGGDIVLKVTQSIWDGLTIAVLWEKCNNPPLPILLS